MTSPTQLRTVAYDEAAAAAALPAATRLGAVHLTVTNLNRSVAFYTSVVGLTEQWRGRTATDEAAVTLGSAGSEPVLVLIESPSAALARRTSGLFHVALRYPTRDALGHVVRRLGEGQTPVQGASDHGTHEAVYLADPDGHGLELAVDRPLDQWPSAAEEFSSGGPRPLDVAGLLSTIAGQPTEARSAGVVTGHLHLHVASIADSERFYRDVVGLALVASLGTAIFMSAGGYHHHLGANIWNGPGAPPAALGSVAMRRWTIVLPSDDDLAELRSRIAASPGTALLVEEDGAILVRDPSGNVVSIESEAGYQAAEPHVQRPTPAGLSR